MAGAIFICKNLTFYIFLHTDSRLYLAEKVKVKIEEVCKS